MTDTSGALAQPNVVVNPSYLGRMEEFKPGSDWKRYVERLEMFFEVNSIPTDKRVPSILTLMGSKMYGLLRSISAPRKPKELSFTEIVDSLSQHLDPKPIVIAERFKFHKAEQQESESIRQFLAKLQKLAETCEFRGYLEEAIRDRFVCGLRVRSIQRKLLAEATLSLQTAVEKACAAELTEKETSVLHGDARVKKGEGAFPECFRCAKRNHSSESCYYRNVRCHRCQKSGHIAPKCPEKRSQRKPTANGGENRTKQKKQKKQGGIHSGEDTPAEPVKVYDPVDKTAWPMFTIVDSHARCKAFIVPVLIHGKSVDMELDTGASVTIVPKSVWNDVLTAKPLQQTDVKLRSCSGHEIPVVGEAKVQVSYGNQEAHLPIIVTANDGPVLMGRNWLSVLKLDWKEIKQIFKESSDTIEDLTTKYAPLFDGGLGTIKGVTAHLKLKANATPKFFKPRPVPFALKEKIAEELKRLERLGVLEKVEFYDWASPIVPVFKPDGTVRICGDYKVTINPELDEPEYPMPTAEELFTQLNGGEKFSKLDLSSAYQQVLLDEESKQYVTSNTHLGLFRDTRLRFGVAASPAIFKQTMDSIMGGLNGVGGILDDLIVTGSNDEEHFRNLESTLKRLHSMGVKLKQSKCVFMKPLLTVFLFFCCILFAKLTVHYVRILTFNGITSPENHHFMSRDLVYMVTRGIP